MCKSKNICDENHTYMPTQSRRNCIPNPENIAATKDTNNSLKMSLDIFVAVTSYTKNHAVKNTPIESSNSARWGNTAGFTGETYLAIDSISNCNTNNM